MVCRSPRRGQMHDTRRSVRSDGRSLRSPHSKHDGPGGAGAQLNRQHGPVASISSGTTPTTTRAWRWPMAIDPRGDRDLRPRRRRSPVRVVGRPSTAGSASRSHSTRTLGPSVPWSPPGHASWPAVARHDGSGPPAAACTSHTLPAGAGLSSSAALSVALAEVFDGRGTAEEVARLGQRAEHSHRWPIGRHGPAGCAAAPTGHPSSSELLHLSSRPVAVPPNLDIVGGRVGAAAVPWRRRAPTRRVWPSASRQPP